MLNMKQVATHLALFNLVAINVSGKCLIPNRFRNYNGLNF